MDCTPMSLTGCRGLDMPLEITENLHVRFLFKIMFFPPTPNHLVISKE